MTPAQLFILLIAIAAIVGFFVNNYNRERSGGLHPDIIRAAGGNKALARRLMQQVRYKHPGKSERWYREKVIYDLGRDRGVIKASRSRFSINRRELKENIFLVGGVLWVLNSLTTLVSRWFR